jgi:prepilin-type N-terminal cleavage/methylation domain-containing protein
MIRPRRARRSAGFTMVEMVVALVLLSFGAMTLGTLMFRASRASRVRSTATYRTAALTAQVERLGAIPFDSVLVGAGCATVSGAPFPHNICTTVTSLSTVSRQAVIVVTPTGGDPLPPDTAVLVRTDPVRAEPLSTP